MLERVYPTPPFDFRQMLQRPLSRPSRICVIDPKTLSYTRVLRLGRKAVPVTITAEGTVDEPVLTLVYPDDLEDGERAQLREIIQFMLSTQADLNGFYEMSHEPEWAALIGQLRGLRPILDADLFESMVKAIVGQQLNVQFAATLVERLVDLGGEAVAWQGERLPVFPSAELVASWSYEQLRALSFSQRKAEYVIDFARKAATGDIDLAGLRALPDEDVSEVLVQLRGIGRWTVECLLLFGLGRPDVMPAADIGVQNAIQKLYGLTDRPREEAVRTLAQNWMPWRSYATYYLWQSLIHRDHVRPNT